MEKTVNKYILHGFLFSTLFVLAYFNDWNYDETCTYLFVKTNSVGELFTYHKFKLANHHLLNSLYFKLIQQFDFKQVIFYRLPSLLSFLIFWHSNKKILEILKIHKNYIFFLTIAPYLIYFTLGRGYGFSLAMCSLSLMYLLQFKENKTDKYETLFLSTGILSVLSIFSFLYVFIGMLGIYLYLNREKNLSLNSIIKLTVVLLLLIYVYYAGKIINESDPNIIGSKTFFQPGTISSFFSEFSYHNYQSILNEEVNYSILKKLVFLSLLLPIILFAFNGNREKTTKDASQIILLIFSSMLLMLISNYFFHAKFPTGRAIIYLEYLYLLLMLVFLRNVKLKYAKFPLLFLFVLSLYMNSTHFIELLKKPIKSVLIETKNYPLYVSNTNPNIRLVNSFEKIKNNEMIIQSKSIFQISKWIQQDSSSIMYVLCKKNECKDLNVPFKEVSNYREGFTLLIVKK